MCAGKGAITRAHVRLTALEARSGRTFDVLLPIAENAVMRLEPLTRLVEISDFLSFREIALRTLALRGYVQPSLTDGPSDGGTDVRVFQIPPNPARLAVQLSVERDWRKKLRSDAAKIKEKLSLQDVLFVTSRRVPEAEFQILSAEIWRDLDLRVNRIDAQGIASTFVEHGATHEVLQILGIPTAGSSAPPTRADAARLDATYAFIFFGNEPTRFRERMTESALVTVAVQYSEGVARAELENEARVALQFPERRRSLITGAVDRMIQKGDFRSVEGLLLINPTLRENTLAIRAVKDIEWAQLRREVSATLKKMLRRTLTDDSIESIMAELGSLLLSTADATFQALGRTRKRSVAVENIKQNLRRVHATLDAAGVRPGTGRDSALQAIAELAGRSPIGKHLVAGEVYRALSSVTAPHLVQALGGESEIETYLDASVAIPILAGLLYEPGTAHRYFVAAFHAYEQLSALELPILLPVDYLEEVATHLYLAYQDYSQVVNLDSDLIASENAFVAHYAGLRLAGTELSFAKYLKGLGLDESLRTATLYTARDALMPKLERLFGKYGIKTVRFKAPNRAANKRAEEMVAEAINALDLSRPSIVLRHDARAMAYLIEREEDASRAVVLCTWDTMHFWILEREHPSWDVMDPAVLGDILALTTPRLEDAPVVAPAVVARMMSEETAREGAAVWDAIVKLERGKLHDADLLAQAEEFKRHYLIARKQGLSTEDVAQAWVKWKKGNGHANDKAG